MTWVDDRFWNAASRMAVEALSEADVVLVPQEFLELDARFAPLEFSWGILLDGCRVAFCCSKDDADRLAPSLRDAALSVPGRHRWANEVFIVGANFEWRSTSKLMLREHLGHWQTKVSRHRRGIAARPSVFKRVFRRGAPFKGPTVLVVGASNMGNVGDDLLAETIGNILYDAGAGDVLTSGPDIDPIHLRPFDAIVVGGGGLIYASREGKREWQNLANYLKFGPICRAMSIPVALIGVGDQDDVRGIEDYPLVEMFARSCLPLFHPVTVRDKDSAKLLASLGARDVHLGSDLVFLHLDRARRAPRPDLVGPPRLAFAGELFRYAAFEESLRQAESGTGDLLQGLEFDYLVMSEDDLSHGKRLRQRFQACGAAVSIVDLRGRDVESISYEFSSVHGLITTRFHGLVFAMISGIPFIALDVDGGKKARLLQERQDKVSAVLVLNADDQIEGAKRLLDFISGNNSIPSMDDATLQFEQALIHDSVIKSWIPSLNVKERLDAIRTVIRPEEIQRLSLARMVGRSTNAGNTSEQLLSGGEVGLCWAASTAETLGFANLGDSLSAVVVASLAGKRVRHVAFDAVRAKLVAIGSIGHAISGGTAIMWGCGVSIRGGILPTNVPRTSYDVRAVRGPISAGHLRRFNIPVPDVFGDPAWFLPSIFREVVEKKYELGVIPHIQDVEGFGPQARPGKDSLRFVIDEAEKSSVVLFNTWHEPNWAGIAGKLRLLLSCKRIISQSFHGLVLAEAYRIPVMNLRTVARQRNGPLNISLREPCSSDPRVWEFYAGSGRVNYTMYSQRRDRRTDWKRVIDAIDKFWEPLFYDASALAASFPMRLAYDPLISVADTRILGGIKF